MYKVVGNRQTCGAYVLDWIERGAKLSVKLKCEQKPSISADFQIM